MELDIFPAPQEMNGGNMGQQQTLLHHSLTGFLQAAKWGPHSLLPSEGQSFATYHVCLLAGETAGKPLTEGVGRSPLGTGKGHCPQQALQEIMPGQ